MTRPSLVPKAIVRRLPRKDEQLEPVAQHVAPPLVSAPVIVPRQIDPMALRLLALQLENDELRAQLQQQRTG